MRETEKDDWWTARNVARLGYTFAGLFLGIFLGYFGAGFIFVGISRYYGMSFHPGNPYYNFFWSGPYQLFGLVISPIIGVIIMYELGKKRRFRTPKYDPDYD